MNFPPSNNSRVLCGVAGGMYCTYIHIYIEKLRDFAIDYYFYLTLLNWEGLFNYLFYFIFHFYMHIKRLKFFFSIIHY